MTIFNIVEQHVKYVCALLKSKDTVIIHGDGHIFASNKDETVESLDDKGQRVYLEKAVSGSEHHKTYNAGWDANEAVAKAGYRAIYHKGDAAPKTVKDIEQKFIEQFNTDLSENINIAPEIQSNIFKLDEPEVKAVKANSQKGKPE